MKTCFTLILCLFVAGKSFGQVIELMNPSFEEDNNQCCTTPSGWYNCGPREETPPDIQPGFFGVDLPAADGNNYLCMVVRENNTWESIGQELPAPLQKDSIYLLKMSVARAPKVISASRLTGLQVNLSTPVKLRIWGGNDYCAREVLLGESLMVSNTNWQELTITLQPASDVLHLCLEAYYTAPETFSYNGNILIDNISLTQIP